LRLVGFALGGEAGARLVNRLGMSTSPSTLLRYVRGAMIPAYSSPRVLGIDDFALRRAKRYGTILVDLEQHRPIELLPDRTSETLVGWLKEHPGIEIISRDRAGAYADGAREGAPEAVQVADRWHLLKNLTETLERFTSRHHGALQRAATSVIGAQLITNSLAEAPYPKAMLSSREEREGRTRREKRYARYQEVMELHQSGLSQRAIAKALGINRATVRKFIHADVFPERAPHKGGHRSILEPYIPYIHQRWVEGCDNALQLWREIKEKGYGGQAGLVRRYARRLRAQLAELTPEHQRARLLEAKTTFKAPSSRRAAWWLVEQTEDLDDHQRAFIEQLCCLCPEAKRVQEMAKEFRRIFAERQAESLDAWLDTAEQSGVAEFEGFARTLRQDYEAVAAALKYEWSNGQVEGQINRLKFIKRQMYGRASFDLLRQRVLRAA
jgi:transposase